MDPLVSIHKLLILIQQCIFDAFTFSYTTPHHRLAHPSPQARRDSSSPWGPGNQFGMPEADKAGSSWRNQIGLPKASGWSWAGDWYCPSKAGAVVDPEGWEYREPGGVGVAAQGGRRGSAAAVASAPPTDLGQDVVVHGEVTSSSRPVPVWSGTGGEGCTWRRRR